MAIAYSAHAPATLVQPIEADFLVKGARCGACLAKIESEMVKLRSVRAAKLNLTTGKLHIAFRRDADLSGVIGALQALGYPAAPFEPELAESEIDREGRRLLMALGVAAFGAGNAMMFSVPIWAGLSGQELGPGARTFMQWASAIIGAPCAIYAGMPFFESAWRALRRGKANMDVPITIGVLLTLAISFSEAILKGRDTYFDAAVSLLFLLLIGRYLDHRLRSRAQSAAKDLLALQAPLAHRFEHGALADRPLKALTVGDLILVRPGERIPADGVVEEGSSELDNALLTGETAPVAVKLGGVCRAGSVNLTGALRIRLTAAPGGSALADLARLVEVGAQTRSRYVRLADKAAAIYVPVVHLAAAATFLIGWGVGLGPREALLRAVAVLIVTCPCALGLATPAVQIAASTRLFRRGILVKSGAALERLAEVRHIAFDKTGVLTMGRPEMTSAFPGAIALAAPLARASSHPLARALAKADSGHEVAKDAVEFPGQGVEGLVSGRRARLGSAAFVGETGVSSESELWFDDGAGFKLRFAFRDALRPGALETIRSLRDRGFSLELISGDLRQPVEALAKQLGIERWSAQLDPRAKTEAIKRQSAAGWKALMVGDGLNDAGALSHAHASMAPGTAIDASQNAADLVFQGDSLDAVIEAIETARLARRRALENFAFSAAYNLIAAPAAMLGLINPMVAALAMSGSSIIVMLNAARMNFGSARR